MIVDWFRSWSLRTKMTVFTFAIFLIGLWSLSLYASRMLREDTLRLVSAQQFSAVTLLANQINLELEERLAALNNVAGRITPAMMANPSLLQAFLEDRFVFAKLFSGGFYVSRADGIAIADIPLSTGRIGIDISDRAWMADALKGNVVVGKPVIGEKLRVPVFSMAAPIFDSKRKVIGVLVGVTNLSKPNFLNKVTDNRYAQTGGYLLCAPRDRIFITGTDKSFNLKPFPRPGANPLFDKYLSGYEGSGTVVDTMGMEVLSSAKQIPAASWMLVVRMPAKEAYAPIIAMQQRMWVATIVLTLLAGGAAWLLLRRQLAPVWNAVQTLSSLPEKEHLPQPLPVTRRDEIGRLIMSFNQLLQKVRWREEALRKSESLYRQLFESITEGFYVAMILRGDDGRPADYVFMEVNQAFIDLIGLTREEIVGRRLLELVPNVSQKWLDIFVKVAATGEPVRTEHYSRSFRKYFKTIAYRPTENEFAVLVEDITEHKRVEKELQDSHELLSLFMRYSPIYAFIKEVSPTQSTVLQASDNFSQMIGIAGQHMVGRTMEELFPPEFAAKMTADDWSVASKGEILQLDEEFNNRSYRTVKFPITVTGKTLLAGYSIDVTDQRKAENLLVEATERLRLATAAAKAGVWDWNLETKAMLWDDRMMQLYGIKRDNFTGSVAAWEEGLHPDDAARAILECEAALRGERNFDTEFRVRHQDGREIHIKADGLVLRDSQGNPSRMIGINTDITERKRMEEMNKLLQDRLSRSEKMEALGLMAGGVAHDLNNALGLLVGYAEFLHDDFDDSDPRKEDARNILMGGEQAAAVVQDLLTLARRGVQTKTTVNLNKIVREYLKSPEYMKLTTLHPGIRIRTELEGGLLLIRGSSVHLSKTLTNLVINAAEAMPSGGDLLIRTENRYLDRPVSGYDELRDGDYVVLTVRDEGEGISAGDMQHIFEPFYTKKVMGRSGTGLGLSVVWGTVKDHSGYIDVESRMGEGSTFQLYFPVTEEGESEKDAAISVDHYTGHGERILVIDDVLEQRNLARRILTGLQYEVETAGSGEEGVSCLRERPFDLIVLDMIMDPGIDGFETYRRILEVRPGQRAIIVSGFAETERVKMAQALGAGPFVRKPYIKERIGMAVKKELERKQT